VDGVRDEIYKMEVSVYSFRPIVNHEEEMVIKLNAYYINSSSGNIFHTLTHVELYSYGQVLLVERIRMNGMIQIVPVTKGMLSFAEEIGKDEFSRYFKERVR
jgi:hypothetical protein